MGEEKPLPLWARALVTTLAAIPLAFILLSFVFGPVALSAWRYDIDDTCIVSTSENNSPASHGHPMTPVAAVAITSPPTAAGATTAATASPAVAEAAPNALSARLSRLLDSILGVEDSVTTKLQSSQPIAIPWAGPPVVGAYANLAQPSIAGSYANLAPLPPVVGSYSNLAQPPVGGVNYFQHPQLASNEAAVIARAMSLQAASPAPAAAAATPTAASAATTAAGSSNASAANALPFVLPTFPAAPPCTPAPTAPMVFNVLGPAKILEVTSAVISHNLYPVSFGFQQNVQYYPQHSEKPFNYVVAKAWYYGKSTDHARKLLAFLGGMGIVGTVLGFLELFAIIYVFLLGGGVAHAQGRLLDLSTLKSNMCILIPFFVLVLFLFIFICLGTHWAFTQVATSCAYDAPELVAHVRHYLVALYMCGLVCWIALAVLPTMSKSGDSKVSSDTAV